MVSCQLTAAVVVVCCCLLLLLFVVVVVVVASQEVQIASGAWARFLGLPSRTGLFKLKKVPGVQNPAFIACNADVVVVADEASRVYVLSYATGSVLNQFHNVGGAPGQLANPRGLRLLPDGSGIAIADCGNHRLSLFSLKGAFVKALGSQERGLCFPADVLTAQSADGHFIVANKDAGNVIKLSSAGAVLGVLGKKGSGPTDFLVPAALAWLPNGDLAVLDFGSKCLKVFRC